MPSKSKCEKGFSLIELLIVVTIIGIIAAMAILYARQAQQAARSASAINSLRIIHSSESTIHALTSGFGDYSTLNSSGFLNDPHLQAGSKDHYAFAIVLNADPKTGYSATGTPNDSPTSQNHYFVDETGVIRFNLGAAADSSNTPIQ